jgi:hypothetical protein
VLVARKRQGLTIGRRGALLKAQKQLDLAEKALKTGKSEAVLHHVAASMDIVMSGALGVDVTSATSDHLAELWEARQLDPELLRDILGVQGECDRVRFAAASTSQGGLRPLIETTRGVIERVGRANAPVEVRS